MPLDAPGYSRVHPRHVCWWSRNRLCEFRWSTATAELGGTGIDFAVLEEACAHASACLILEPIDEASIRLEMVLYRDGALHRVAGALHDDCLFTLKPVPTGLIEAIVRSALQSHFLRHAGLRVDLREVVPAVAATLREQAPLRFRTDPNGPQVIIESQKRVWPLGRKRFRPIGGIRLVDGRATVTMVRKQPEPSPLQSVQTA